MGIAVLGVVMLDADELSPRERTALAALALRLDHPVPADDLAEAMWPRGRPATWAKQVQTAVVRLRRVLGHETVETTAVGYALRLGPDEVDAVRFERLVATARDWAGEAEPERAVDLLERALGLWRGRPYADLGDWDPAVAEAGRLEEIRRGAEEDLLDAHLACGEHRSVAADAERLVREEPLRERRWALWALALYRSGRQAEGLAALRRARARFADELGIEPGRELADLEVRMLRHDPGLELVRRAPAAVADCPYRGLSAYGLDDAADFFGREADVRAVVSRLERAPFLAVTGPSGAGKSSLVLAGVVPILVGRGLEPVVVTPSAASAARIREACQVGHWGTVVVVDQLEELFHADGGPDLVAEFCRSIGDRVTARLATVVTVRSDHLDQCAADPVLGPLVAEGLHVMMPMAEAGLRAAIEEPARAAGLRVEAGLVELMVRDSARQSGALPHLSHALVETWLRREGNVLTVQGYLDSGGIGGAIAQSAERLYDALGERERELCRSTLLRLVELDGDRAAVRRRVPLQPLRADAAHQQVLAELARARLVSTEGDTVVLSHESLAEAWPRLRDWLAEDAEGARLMSEVAAAAQAWQAAGRRDDDLYRGARLQAALEWRDRSRPDLTRDETDFLVAAEALASAETRAVAERASRDRRQNRRLRVALVAAACLLVSALLAGGVAVNRGVEAARTAEDGAIEALVSRSAALMASDRDTGALLAAEAYRRWPTDPRTRVALMGAMTAAPGYVGRSYVPGAQRISGDLIPGTRTGFLVRDGTRPAIVDLDTGSVAAELTPLPTATSARRAYTRVSQDGAIAVVAQATEDLGLEVTAFDLRSRKQLSDPYRTNESVSEFFSLSPDGRQAYFGERWSKELHVLDTATGTMRTVTSGVPEAEYDELRVSTAVVGDWVVMASMRTLRAIDPATGRVARQMPIPYGSGSGDLLPVGDGTVLLAGGMALARVDVAKQKVLWNVRYETYRPDLCSWLSIALRRDRVYCADTAGPVVELSLRDGQPTGRSFDGQLGSTGDIRVLPGENEMIVIGAETPSIARWRLDGGGAAATLVAPGRLVSDGFEPRGTLLMTEHRPRRLTFGWSEQTSTDVAVWDPYRRRRVHDFSVSNPAWIAPGVVQDFHQEAAIRRDVRTGQTRPMKIVGFEFLVPSRASGVTYAIAGATVRRWNQQTGELLEPVMNVEGEFSSLTDTPDGRYVAIRYWVPEEVLYRLVVFDTTTGTEVARGLDRHTGATLTADQRVIGSFADGLRVYALPDLELVQTLPKPLAPGPRLQASIDGRTLLIPSLDNTVSLYDLTTGRRLGNPVPADATESITGYLQPDGRAFVVNGSDGVVLWTLDTERHFEAACRMAGRELTDAEWNAYLSDLGPKVSTCEAVLG